MALNRCESHLGSGPEAFSDSENSGMVLRWQPQRNECGGCGIRMPSRGFDRCPACGECSVIRRPVSSRWFDGQKNGVRQLRQSTAGLVRPTSPSDPRFAVRRYASVSGVRGAPGLLSKLWQGEARTTGVFGRQSVLHQAFCVLRRTAVSNGYGPGHRQGTEAGLAHG